MDSNEQGVYIYRMFFKVKDWEVWGMGREGN